MKEYRSSLIVFTLLIIATFSVSYYYFVNNRVIKGTNFSPETQEKNNNNEQYYNEFNYITEAPNYYENNTESTIDVEEKDNSINDITTKEEKEPSIFDKDFSRDNKKTEPEITYYNVLKLGRWEDDTYVNDELGIKIFLNPGWSLHDISGSFHLNEGSGQVNSAVIKPFGGSISNEYEILKSTNSKIFDIVTESKKTINGSEYSILNCKYKEKDYFERNVYFTNTKMDGINIYIETDFYNTDAPFTTRNYELSDIFEKF